MVHSFRALKPENIPALWARNSVCCLSNQFRAIPRSRVISAAGRFPLSSNCAASRFNSGGAQAVHPSDTSVGRTVPVQRSLSNPGHLISCSRGWVSSAERAG